MIVYGDLNVFIKEDILNISCYPVQKTPTESPLKDQNTI